MISFMVSLGANALLEAVFYLLCKRPAQPSATPSVLMIQ
jgi:hypothetical protein